MSEVSEHVQSFALLAEKFRHIGLQGLRRVIELVQIQQFENGGIIFNKDTESEHAYLVLFGEVYLYENEHPAAKPSLEQLDDASRATAPSMKKIDAGGIIGHEAFLTEQANGAYRTSAVAYNRDDPTMVMRMDAEAFDLIVS